MPCRDETHKHHWPKSGTLTICKCEIYCGYCEGEDAKKAYTLQWELRHHIRVVHTGPQGLVVKVSPRPMPHVSTNSKKRDHAEVEQSDSDGDDDSKAAESSEEEVKATEDDSSEEDSEKKCEPMILHSRAPMDPFVDAVKKDTNPVPGPLRLRAKPVARSKKAPLSTHAASFRPIGPKPGPSSPKRARQEVSTGPPLPVTASMAPGPQIQGPRAQQSVAHPDSVMNNQPANSVILDQQRAQLLTRRAAEVQAGMHVQRSVGNSQQMPNNFQPQGRNNLGLAINTQPAQMPGQNYNHPLASAGFPLNEQMNVAPPPLLFNPSDQEYYRRNPHLHQQHAGMPLELLRIRSLTTDLLTNHNTSELLLIDMYSAEVEYIRQLQTHRWISNAHDQSYVSTLRHSGLLAQQQFQQEVTSPMMQQFVGGCVRGHLSNLGFFARQVQGQGGQQQMGSQQAARPGQQSGLQQHGGHHYAPRPMQQMSVQQQGQTQQVGGQNGGLQFQPTQRQISGDQRLQQLPQRQVSGGHLQQPPQHQSSGGPQLVIQQQPLQPRIITGQQLVTQQANSQQANSQQANSQQANSQQANSQQANSQQRGSHQPGPQQLTLQQSETQQSATRPHPPPPPSPQQFSPMLSKQPQPIQQRLSPRQQNGIQPPLQQPVTLPTEPQQHHPTHTQHQPLTTKQAQMKIEEQTRQNLQFQNKK